MMPDFKYFNYDDSMSPNVLVSQVLDYLNSGGTRQSVIAAYLTHYPHEDNRTIQEKDVTGDGIPELLISFHGALGIYVCGEGQYAMKWPPEQTYPWDQPAIKTIKDLNLDGVDEIITIGGDLRTQFVEVFEWDGSEFPLVNWNPITTERNQERCAIMHALSKIELLDKDGNGTLELVLKEDIPSLGWHSYLLPYRNNTRTCAWDGKYFVLTRMEFAPAEYRFQAVQDGDRAVLAGDLDKALNLYQQVIFSDTLQWWSDARRHYEVAIIESQGSHPASTPPPFPTADPAEYPNLAAYARFRIMLVHIVRGYLSDAHIVYETLQEKFPVDRTGHAYAEMATVFWLEYQVSQSFSRACTKAIEYASSHPADIFPYLGNGKYAITYFGDQSLEYKLSDVCPFTASP